MKDYNIDKDIELIDDRVSAIHREYVNDELLAATAISNLLDAKAKLIAAQVGMHGIIMTEKMQKEQFDWEKEDEKEEI